MSIDFDQVLKDMVSAAKAILKRDWSKVSVYAMNEFSKLAHDGVLLAELVVSKKIDANKAELLMQMHKNSSKILLLTIKGMALLTVEAVINAAVAVLSAAINQAVGLSLFV